MLRKRRTDELTVRDAGRLGGLSTLARHGITHYREAGRRGQAKLAAKCSSADRSRWGALGGRPRKVRYQALGEEGNSTNGGMGSPPDTILSPPPIIPLFQVRASPEDNADIQDPAGAHAA